MNTFDVLVQAIGYVSLVLSLLSFQAKRRGVILLLQTLASLFFSCQLFLLPGALAGGLLDLIACLRTLTFSLLAARAADKPWSRSVLIPIGFSVVMIAVGILTWEAWYTVLAILGSVLSTVALFMSKERHIRLISLLVGPCWFVFNIIVGSQAGAINEVIAVTSIIIGIIRHDLPKRGTERAAAEENGAPRE